MIGKIILAIVFLQLTGYAIGKSMVIQAEDESKDYEELDYDFNDNDDDAEMSSMSAIHCIFRDLYFVQGTSICSLHSLTPSVGTSIQYMTYILTYYNCAAHRLEQRCYWRQIDGFATHQFDDNGYLITQIPTQIDNNGFFYQKRIEKFTIGCPDDHYCLLNLLDLDLASVVSEGNRICLDYVQVLDTHLNAGIPKEYCENDSIMNQIFEENVVITFQHGYSIRNEQINLNVMAVHQDDLMTANSCIRKSSIQGYRKESSKKKDNNIPTKRGDNGEWDRELFPNGDNEREREETPRDRFNEKLVKFYEEREGENERGRSSPDGDDEREYFTPNEEYEREMERRIPEGAEEKLVRFYINNHNKALAYSMKLHENILKLAVISENSCQLSLVATAQKVASLFPRKMVAKAKLQAMNEYYKK